MERNSKDLGLVAGANLKCLIKESGMTQEDFAWEFGADARTVRRWLSKGIKNLDTIGYIADFFKVDVFDILSE